MTLNDDYRRLYDIQQLYTTLHNYFKRKARVNEMKKELDSDVDDEGLCKEKRKKGQPGSPNKFVDKVRVEKPYGDKKLQQNE